MDKHLNIIFREILHEKLSVNWHSPKICIKQKAMYTNVFQERKNSTAFEYLF